MLLGLTGTDRPLLLDACELSDLVKNLNESKVGFLQLFLTRRLILEKN